MTVVLAMPVGAQTADRFWIAADNDYFNFWRPPDERPDNDYTQGLLIHLSLLRVPSFARSLVGNGPPCEPSQAVAKRCVSGLIGLTQEIYTPEQDAQDLLPGQRPYLGWLAVGAAVLVVSPKRVDQITLEAGVTGPPSLAEASQKAFHRAFGFREPLGWSGQLPFEPGLIVSYQIDRMFVQPSIGSRRVVAFSGNMRARLGNIATDLRLGACVLFGWNVAGCNPQWPPLGKGFGLGLRAALSGDWVVRSVALDGSTFADGPKVEKESGVLETVLGVEVRVKGIALEWSAIRRGREYRTQTQRHTFSRLRVSF